MEMEIDIDVRRQARLTGALFLAVNAAYIASLVLTAQVMIPGEFSASVQNLAAAERDYRLGAAFQVLASAATILLAGAFFVLLRPVSNGLAIIGLSCRVAESALFGVYAILGFAALYLATAPAAALGAQEGLWTWMLSTQRTTGSVAQVYFAIGSSIFLLLLLRTRIIPRPVTLFGLVATIISLMATIGALVVPEYRRLLGVAGIPLLASEALIGLWLLLGAGQRRAQEVVSAAAQGGSR